MNDKCLSCKNWNGHACKITACSKHDEVITYQNYSTYGIITFPIVIAGITFNTWQEIKDYIWMHEDSRYGIG